MPVWEKINDGLRVIARSPVRVSNENLAPQSTNVHSKSHSGVHEVTRVGNYIIGKKLGEGSFGKVREGLHKLTGEKVALKVINKEKLKTDSFCRKSLQREVLIQQMVHHPNIVQLLHVMETENNFYLVMELCDQGSLQDELCKKKCLKEAQVQQYIRQLVLAVGHLHKAGVVHRDLKLQNLLLDENKIKLIDFGLSNYDGKRGCPDPFSTQCGTPVYSAPEVFCQKYGPKVDVWSIGVIMYTLLTGSLPFHTEPFNLRCLRQKMANRDMKPLPPEISPDADCFLKTLLEPDPEKRPDIQQVMAHPWLTLGSLTCQDRCPVEQVNQQVVNYMTKMGFECDKVRRVVLNHRACHTFTVYHLLKRKSKRLLMKKLQAMVNKQALKP